MNNNRLLNLPVDIFYKITNSLTIFDLENLEKTGLFALNDDGISEDIQVAFERLPNINIEHQEYDESRIRRLVLRCGTGLRSLIVKCRDTVNEGFLSISINEDEEFVEKFIARCPNIERFAKSDYGGPGFRLYIQLVENSKLQEIDTTYLEHHHLQHSFTPNLKSLRFSGLTKFIQQMHALNELNDNFGLNIRQLILCRTCLTAAANLSNDFNILTNFFPNLETVKVKAKYEYGEYIFNREQIYSPDFVHQLDLIARFSLNRMFTELVNNERCAQFNLFSIVKIQPYANNNLSLYSRLINLQSIFLKGNDMMCNFSDCLSYTSFMSLNRLHFAELNLDIKIVPKFERILSTERFSIRTIVRTTSIDIHSVLISLLSRFCRGLKKVDIKLQTPNNVRSTVEQTPALTADECELLSSIGIYYITSIEGREFHAQSNQFSKITSLFKNHTPPRRFF